MQVDRMSEGTLESDHRPRADRNLHRMSHGMISSSAQQQCVDHDNTDVECAFWNALHFAEEQLQISSVATS